MYQVSQLSKAYLAKCKHTTDNWAFRLHYKTTVSLLILFSLLSSTQYFGSKIECTTAKKNVDKVFLNNYCWSHPTFIMVETKKSSEMPHSGIINSKTTENKKQYNAYYQWVAIMLAIQACFMYVPRLMWKANEQRIVAHFLRFEEKSKSECHREEACRQMACLIIRMSKIRGAVVYMIHVSLEFLNLFIVILQIVFMNYFLNMNFQAYGWKVISFDGWGYDHYFDPMTRAFPKMVKCPFFDYGTSGDVQSSDFLCILPYNALNEKIYLFLWFWFQLLILVGLFNLINRFLLTFSYDLRCRTIKTTMFAPKRRELLAIVDHLSIGQWFILDVLNKNLPLPAFENVLEELYEIQYKPEKTQFENHV